MSARRPARPIDQALKVLDELRQQLVKMSAAGAVVACGDG